jgi:hypothetical protein
MADDPTKKDYHDRDRVSGTEEYEVEYFAKQHGIEPDQVRSLIQKFGNNRPDLEREVEEMKRRAH